MKKKKLIIFGGSGHAKDLLATAKDLDYSEFQIVTTDGSCSIDGLTAMPEKDFDPSEFKDIDAIVAIGNNVNRARFFSEYPNLKFVNIIAPSAEVDPSAKLGRGIYIGTNVYIGPDSSIADACIINVASILGHDSKIEAYTHVSPKVCISGHVEIGESCFIGAGVLFNNGSYERPLKIADKVQIGMGCHITQSIDKEGAKLIPKPNYISMGG